MSGQMGKKFITRSLISVAISLLLVILALAIIFNRQLIYDQLAYNSYQASTDVLTLVSNSGMSQKGQFLFLASKPVLDDTASLYKECAGVENSASVLGCYKNKIIYIFDVHDERIASVREVTAAHELLHAIYDRLSYSQRDKLDDLLFQEYEKLKLDEDFMARMAAYTNIDDSDLANELHSIIGTEVAVIGPELESHYSKYFYNRQKIVNLNKSYLSVFDELKAKANKLITEIDSLGKDIKQASGNYNDNIGLLNRDIGDFNRRADSGWFTSQAQFQHERSVLTSRVNAMENARLSINRDITKYNELINKYNSIATESTRLYNSLDSSLAPTPSI